jgi:transcriptional regulator with XRE-family HTH domain
VGISQRELARRSGVPGPVISAIERSHRQPSVPTMAKLLRGLDLELHLDAVRVGTRPSRIGAAAPMSGGQGVSLRHVSASERLRAHQVYSALDLADRIKRARANEADRGVR